MKMLMKGLAVITTASLILVACSKTGMNENDLTSGSLTRIEAVTSAPDFDSKVQQYNLLRPAERYKLWKDHFAKARTQFSNAGQTAKVTLIDRLIANTSVSVFDDIPGTAADVFSNYFMPVWTTDAKQVMTDLEIYDITFDPTVSVIGRATPEIPDDNGAGCFCHVGTSGFSCRRISVGFPSGITITNGVCENNAACGSSGQGCGWLWLQSCNGNHCNF